MPSMKAAVLHGINDIRVEEIEMPSIKSDDEVLIRIRAVGICGSDIHYYREGRIGRFVVTKPHILGHECAGEIVEVGKAVKHLKPGDKVAIEPGVGCRRCKYCHEGRYNLCPDETFMGTPPTGGAFTEYVVWSGDFVYKLPEEVPYEAGALCEPLAVALHAINMSDMKPAATVAVLGCGPIGLALIQAALASGAARVIATDIYPLRLDKAKELGASEVFNAKEVDAVQAILDATGGEGADVVFEAAGSVTAQRQSFSVVKSGGVIVLVGMTAETVTEVPLLDLITREYQVRGILRYANSYPQAVAFTILGKVNLLPIVTHRFPLDSIVEALEVSDTRKDESIKVMIKMD
ncbi:MAG: NAD(P)-dependent alcohol dehydrogenase [Armatimonadota bacterium]|nr:NAD(P)-dependent alcohol dehydrogenase [Armatimonadota bacterium]MCX7776996.1 NAD(P)-dependent alcohol dehydrogenase [Armatimonadota bacterium]MDW8024830.1 NAD(P)-dependent alcohol dehydrogenase [Armatimonadota bacterium]